MKRRRFLITCMVATAIITMAAGCGTKQDETGTQESVGEEVMQEIQLADSNGNVVTDVKERGLRFRISQEFLDKGLEVDFYNKNTKGFRIITLSYYSPTYKQLLDEVLNMKPEEQTPEISDQYMQQMWEVSRPLMEIAMVDTKEYEALTASGMTPEDFTYHAPAELFGTNGEYTYIISIPELGNGNLNETEQKVYQECKDYMQTVKENISFIPVELENDETVVGEYMPKFETEDLDGNIITNDIFSQYKLTVVNVWGTFCGPCIDEMPELAQWSEEMPKDVQIIGLVGDIAGKEDTEHLELARQIVKKAKVDFTNLIANEDFVDIMDGIIGFPTTFFVDQNGNMVGEPIVGADIECYKAFVEEYCSE